MVDYRKRVETKKGYELVENILEIPPVGFPKGATKYDISFGIPEDCRKMVDICRFIVCFVQK